MNAQPRQGTLLTAERTTRIPVRVTPREKAQIEKVAKVRRITVSQLLRNLALEEADKLETKGKAA